VITVNEWKNKSNRPDIILLLCRRGAKSERDENKIAFILYSVSYVTEKQEQTCLSKVHMTNFENVFVNQLLRYCELLNLVFLFKRISHEIFEREGNVM